MFRIHCEIDVDGAWSNYESYGSCSVTCGTGEKYRTRSCTSPKPSGKGTYCTGNAFMKTACPNSPCSKKLLYVFDHEIEYC